MRNLLMGALLAFSVASSTACQSEGNKDKKDDNKGKEYFGVPQKENKDSLPSDLIQPGEKHFKNMRQLTFAGNNAEAYFSFDGQKITFQSDNAAWGAKCDQIFFFDLHNANMKEKAPQLISTGMGRTTCSYFLPGDTEILYASTHLGGKDCPPKPAQRADHKYVWPIYDSYDIFVADLHGRIKRQLTHEMGYDAEATISPKGDKIVYTSTKSGDLELWIMNIDGSGKKQLTSGLGYDGGAFFSPDGKQLVFRASRPKTKEDKEEYEGFYKTGLVSPLHMEIYTINIDGSGLKQITNLGNANWAPFFDHSGKKIIFSSNHEKGGYHFNLWMINVDGTGLEKISGDKIFDAFPMFSPDGKKIIFSSNRNNTSEHEINLFIADWVD